MGMKTQINKMDDNANIISRTMEGTNFCIREIQEKFSGIKTILNNSSFNKGGIQNT